MIGTVSEIAVLDKIDKGLLIDGQFRAAAGGARTWPQVESDGC
jgi:hypothetical protein